MYNRTDLLLLASLDSLDARLADRRGLRGWMHRRTARKIRTHVEREVGMRLDPGEAWRLASKQGPSVCIARNAAEIGHLYSYHITAARLDPVTGERSIVASLNTQRGDIRDFIVKLVELAHFTLEIRGPEGKLIIDNPDKGDK